MRPRNDRTTILNAAADRISTVLSACPGQSAKMISRQLGLARHVVNSALHNNPNRFVKSIDQPPLWSLASTELLDQGSGLVQAPATEPFATVDDLAEHLCELNWITINFAKDLSNTLSLMPEFKVAMNFRTFSSILRSTNLTLSDQVNQELLRLLHTGAYVNVAALVDGAVWTDWRKCATADILLQRPDRIARKFREDLDFLALRYHGFTLDELGELYELTRERVRQRLLRFRTFDEHIKTTSHEKQRAQDERLLRDIHINLRRSPGVSLDTLAQQCSLSTQEVTNLLPSQARRFLAPLIRSSTMTWSDNDIIQAIKTAATFEYPLSTETFDSLVRCGEISCCSTVRIMQRFGLWSAACEAAGIESKTPFRSHYDRNWTHNELIEAVAFYLLDKSSTGTFADFADWLQKTEGMPSAQTVRNHLGQWGSCLELGLEAMQQQPLMSSYELTIDSIFGPQ